VLYAGTQGQIDKVPVARVKEWETGFVRFLRSERPGVLQAIEEKKALDDGLFERLKAAISTFNHQFGVEGYGEVADPAPKAEAAAPTASPASPQPAGPVRPKAPSRKKASK
jgi:hypothetical protein